MDLIVKGDTVYVQLDPSDQVAFSGVVVYVPQEATDDWIIKDERGGIHYVQSYCQIVRRCQPKERP